MSDYEVNASLNDLVLSDPYGNWEEEGENLDVDLDNIPECSQEFAVGTLITTMFKESSSSFH